MKNLIDQLKQYWFLIIFIFGGVAAITKLVAGSYVGDIATGTIKNDATKQYITELVAAELAAAQIVAAINGKLELHESQIAGNKDAIHLTQSQLQDVARILMNP